MPSTIPLSTDHFYDQLPSSDHRTGDIWRNLPTFGVINRTSCTGIVITPACDLANKKTETITYLPIVKIQDYLISPAFRYDCWQEIQQLLSRLPYYKAILPPARFDLIPENDLSELINTSTDSAGKKLSEAELTRLYSYKNYVQNSSKGSAKFEDIKGFTKPERLENIISRLITNSLKSDTHFLPKDNRHQSYSAIQDHSVALFRHTLSLPIEALNTAQTLSIDQWNLYTQSHADRIKTLAHMPEWPIKLSTLKSEFLSDLISRYISMYIRLGSSDFSEETIATIANEAGN